MSLSQCRRVEARDSYLHLHGLVFETSIYSWQDQPGKLASFSGFFAAPFSRRFARRRDLTPRTLPPPRAGRSPSVPRLRARFSAARTTGDGPPASCCSNQLVSRFSPGVRSSGRSMRHPCLGFRNPIGHPPLTYVSFPAGVRPAARCNILVWAFAIRSAIRRSHTSLFRPAFVRPLDATSLCGLSQSDRPSAAHIGLFSGRRSSGRSLCSLHIILLASFSQSDPPCAARPPASLGRHVSSRRSSGRSLCSLHIILLASFSQSDPPCVARPSASLGRHVSGRRSSGRSLCSLHIILLASFSQSDPPSVFSILARSQRTFSR